MTVKLKNLIPAMSTHPGEILNDELDSRKISQKDFATDIGISVTQLNEVIKGKRNITADFALVLEKALGIDAKIWMNFQTAYELDVSRIKEKTIEKLSQVERWNTIKQYVPVSFFKKEGYITDNLEVNENKIKEIYNVDNIDGIINATAKPCYARFKKSTALSESVINVVGWQKLVEYKAKRKPVDLFALKDKEELIEELKKLSTKKNLISNTDKLLAKYGIKFIDQEKPEKAPIDGIAFWSEKNPVIGITKRHKRIDNFIFTIMHELGHIYLHLLKDKKREFVDDLDNHLYLNGNAEEKEANDFASKNLIPLEKWENFMENHYIVDDQAIIDFAAELKIHPSIVRGRLCHENHSYYKKRTAIVNKLS
jgi:HTH-type transcriptional regulator / antitoxin HigA